MFAELTVIAGEISAVDHTYVPPDGLPTAVRVVVPPEHKTPDELIITVGFALTVTTTLCVFEQPLGAGAIVVTS